MIKKTGITMFALAVLYYSIQVAMSQLPHKALFLLLGVCALALVLYVVYGK